MRYVSRWLLERVNVLTELCSSDARPHSASITVFFHPHQYWSGYKCGYAAYCSFPTFCESRLIIYCDSYNFHIQFILKAIVLYWTVSSMCGLSQHLVLLAPSVRRKLGIPYHSKEIEKPYHQMLHNLKARFSKSSRPS